MEYKKIDVSSGSIVMACGIFLLGAIHQFSWFDIMFGQPLTFILILVWAFMVIKFVSSISNQEYRGKLNSNPMSWFGAGTWIAGSSVIGILIINRLPQLMNFFQVIIILNVVSWLLFIGICIGQFIKMFINQTIKDVHGSILLTTVSTQSIVCLLLNYFMGVNDALIITLIGLGLCFYIFSICLIIVRFKLKLHKIHEWKNSDCIIHGALSITGLAMTQSQLFTINVMLIFWYIVFGIFILVELVEVSRAISRIKMFGIGRGILTYDISQWARNFTFGMFYFFTLNMVTLYGNEKSFLFQVEFLHILGWIIFAILLFELYLLFRTRIKRTSQA